MRQHIKPKHPKRQVKIFLLLHLYKSKLRHQNVLEKKDASEAQEEQTRRQKERLQLEADIVASMEKMSVFKTSVSEVRNAAPQELDGM